MASFLDPGATGAMSIDGFDPSSPAVPPTLNCVAPPTVQALQGGTITLNGSGFASATKVTTGGVQLVSPGLDFTIVNDTTITFNPASPVAGQSLTVAADVVNLGSTPLSASMLRVYDGDPAAGHLIVELPVAPLDGLARARISVLWDTHDKAGDHVLHFVIDPLNVIAESNEADNRASRGVTVRAPDAGIDLSIAASDITLSPGTLGGVPQPQSLVAVG